jgi:glycosyltransferase involved in cell wall biosynthesis
VRISVVVPAHNEERWIGRGLDAIAAAQRVWGHEVETVVVANRCTDQTAELAEAAGAIVVESPARNIAAVRNAGVGVATGECVVTIDADCRMAANGLRDMVRLLDTGRFVGGGTAVVPERSSAGIRATIALVEVVMFVTRLGGGMFWCLRRDFDAVGGFDESLLIAEDLDFARRLRAHGRRTGRRFTTLRSAPIVVSTRKFDRYGDWHMFAMATQLRAIRAAQLGTDASWADEYFFDFNADAAA